MGNLDVIAGSGSSTYLSGRASKALTEAMHPAQEVLWSASLAKSCFSTTMSLKGSMPLAMPLPPQPLVLAALRGMRAFFLSLAHRDTFAKEERKRPTRRDASNDTPGNVAVREQHCLWH